MRSFPANDASLPRISQIDCLSTSREDLNLRGEKSKELQNRKNMSQAATVKAQSYGRNRSNNLPGVLPPISQISMGGRQASNDRSPQEGLKLPPISQVACLGGVDDTLLADKTRKSRDRDNDSDFIKLSKAGGQKGLLRWEADSIVRGTECDGHSVSRPKRLRRGFISEADPSWKPSHWSGFTRRGDMRVSEKMIWR